MLKKTRLLVIALLFAATPVFADAQSGTVSESDMVAALQQLIAVLTQELSSLIAARGHGTTIATISNQANIPTKTIQASGTAPQAVIDQAYLTVLATPDPVRSDMVDIAPISGAAANTTGVAVVLINGPYSGPTDFVTASRFGQFQSGTSSAPMPILFMNVPVVNGRWQTDRLSFVQQPPPYMTILVYSNPTTVMSGVAQPIAQATMSISGRSSGGASVDQALTTIPATPDPSYKGFSAIAPFTGTATGVKYVSLVAINGSYSGPTDFGTASAISADTGTSGPSVVFPNLPVYNGRWRSGRITFATLPPSLMSIFVYESGATSTASSSLPMVRASVVIASASTTATSTVATAFVDQGALPVQASADAAHPGSIIIPPLTGSAVGESSLSVVVIPGSYSGSPDFYAASRIRQTVPTGGNDTLPLLFLNVPVLSGKWQTGAISLAQAQPPSQLTVLVYDYASAAKSFDSPIAESTVNVLPTLKPSQILTVYPSGTIDQDLSTLQLSADPSTPGLFDTPPLTGTVKNSGSVTVVVISGSYTGKTDFTTVSHLSQTTAGANTPTFFLFRPVVNGRWQTGPIAYTLPHPSTLTVLVYDAGAASAGTGEPFVSSVLGL